MAKARRINIAILHNIRSSENVGSMFRTADASGINKIYLTGYSPLPINSFGKKCLSVHKTALGAEEFIEWDSGKIMPLLKKLKKDNFQIIAIEQNKKSINFHRLKLKNKNVFIVGNEVSGLPKNILHFCDKIIEIPMHGKKESLNVSVAFGVALYKLF